VCLCNKSTSQCEIWQYFVSFSLFFINVFIANGRNISNGFFILYHGIFGNFNHFHWKFGGFWFKFIKEGVIIWTIKIVFWFFFLISETKFSQIVHCVGHIYSKIFVDIVCRFGNKFFVDVLLLLSGYILSLDLTYSLVVYVVKFLHHLIRIFLSVVFSFISR